MHTRAWLQVVTESDFIAVEFFAPWCGHCKRLEPEWAAAAETFANSPPAGLDVEVKLAAVDATAETELATKYGIRGYPTIKIFRNGDLENPQEYQGPREKAGIISVRLASFGCLLGSCRCLWPLRSYPKGRACCRKIYRMNGTMGVSGHANSDVRACLQYLSTMAGPAVMRVASETEAADLFGSSNIIVFAVGDDLLSAVEPIAGEESRAEECDTWLCTRGP